MSGVSINMDFKSLTEAYARLKGIPLAKVLRNAARDFVRAARKATPEAKVKRAIYVRATMYETTDEVYTTKRGKVKTRRAFTRDAAGKRVSTGKSWYIPINRVGKLKRNNTKTGLVMHKVRIAHGWSKATWLGAMAALGIGGEAKRPASIPPVAEARSTATAHGDDIKPAVTITDQVRIDHFGRGTSTPVHNALCQAGFAAAVKSIVNDYTKLARQAWRGQR